MDNRGLFKTSLTLALIGILLLFVYSETITPKPKDISQINEKDLDKTIKIVGQITRVTDLPGIILLNLKDNTSQITILIFKEEKLNIKQNDFLEIEGKITEYKGQLEIEAEKITRI